MAERARFLFQSNHFSKANEIVRPSAFLPRNGETSVFDIVDLEDADIRSVGDDVGVARGKPPKGRGEFQYDDAESVGLAFERDDIPPRHGNLVGWPDDGSELKARQKAVAVALSARAVLVLR